MFCPSCGKPTTPQQRCSHCQAMLPVTTTDDDAVGLLVPIKTSIWAIAAGYLALISVLLIPAPLALLTGIIALIHLSRSPGKRGKVRAWLGIVLGSLGTIGLVYYIVLNR